jgi:hypothetical protein
MWPPSRKTKREASEAEATNPSYRRKAAKRWYHARGACLSPYKDFSRWQTWSGRARSTKPGGCWQ